MTEQVYKNVYDDVRKILWDEMGCDISNGRTNIQRYYGMKWGATYQMAEQIYKNICDDVGELLRDEMENKI